jgi:BCD family chlorophyll transporter-like MFS transporter
MKMAFRLPPALIGVFSRYVPFADAASPDLPLARLLRLSLFQVAVGIAAKAKDFSAKFPTITVSKDT